MSDNTKMHSNLDFSGDELDMILESSMNDSDEFELNSSELELEPDEPVEAKMNSPKPTKKDDDFDDGFDDDFDDRFDDKASETLDEDFDEDEKLDDDEAPGEVSKQQQSKKVMYFVWVICAAFFIVFFAVTKASDGNKIQTVEDSKGGVVENVDSSVFHVENLEVGQIMYKDYLVISKYISMEGSNLVPKFTGNLESYGQTVEVAVDLDTYNNYPSGSRVSVVFYKTTVDNVEKIVIVQVQPVK